MLLDSVAPRWKIENYSRLLHSIGVAHSATNCRAYASLSQQPCWGPPVPYPGSIRVRTGFLRLLHFHNLPDWVPRIFPLGVPTPSGEMDSFGVQNADRVDWKRLAQELEVPELADLLPLVAKRTLACFRCGYLSVCFAVLTHSAQDEVEKVSRSHSLRATVSHCDGPCGSAFASFGHPSC